MRISPLNVYKTCMLLLVYNGMYHVYILYYLLHRWFNYQLEQAGSRRRVNNFGKDIMVSSGHIEHYYTLIHYRIPSATLSYSTRSPQMSAM